MSIDIPSISKRRKQSEKIVNDIVHGIIKLPSYILEIVDSPQFQRLRWVSQIAFAQFVYQTATASRFEHSIGTYYLASCLVKQIENQIKEERLTLDFTENEIKCVEIAALCHDIGHGPYSHSWEHEVKPLLEIEKENQKSHEELSCEILSDLMNNTLVVENSYSKERNIKDIINLTDDDMDLIKRIILGKYDREIDKKKKFLFEIVANKSSGLDVDKFDYLCRDACHLGWSNKNKIQDILRIMHYFRVIKNENDEWCLALKEKVIFSIHEIFYFRHKLHRYATQHKTVRAIDCMFKDAMKKIINNEEYRRELIENIMGKTIPFNSNEKRFLHSKEFISKACDFHIWNIMNKYTFEIVKNISERNLYKLFSQILIEKKNISQKATGNNNSNKESKINHTNIERKNDRNVSRSIHECVENLEILLNKLLKDNNINNTIRITLSMFSLANEEIENPMLQIYFYNRDHQDKCFRYNKENMKLPELASLTFREYVMMIFTEFSVENKKEKNILNDAIHTLCTDQNEDSQRVVFVTLQKSYKFFNINSF